MKELRILLTFSNLVAKTKTTKITAMHNFFANFVKILEVCKHFVQVYFKMTNATHIVRARCPRTTYSVDCRRKSEAQPYRQPSVQRSPQVNDRAEGAGGHVDQSELRQVRVASVATLEQQLVVTAAHAFAPRCRSST